MPELAEVEFFRKRWHLAAVGERIVAVLTHDREKLFRELDLPSFRQALVGATLVGSEARAKQMLFRFRRRGARTKHPDGWLGIHLGMTGTLRVESRSYVPDKHDHVVIVTESPPRRKNRRAPSRSPRAGNSSAGAAGHSLVLNDPRMFGRVRFHVREDAPVWWTRIAPAVLSPQFTVDAVADFLRRRRRAPIKAVLLMQERFPGIGNWMADEILWRAEIHPARPAGTLSAAEVRALWRQCRHVCRLALDAIAGCGSHLPPDLNVNIPGTWLFHHRWRKGGRCPKTGAPLAHSTIGGRTSCWSPARQSPKHD